jgi:two-component system OmpR family sensor kinase
VALDLAAEGDADVAREALADIAGDLHELEGLLADVLAWARLDLGDGSPPSGALPRNQRRVDVRAQLEQAVARFRLGHPERMLETDVADELPPIEGDDMLLRRVVTNLLENAHKYSADGDDPVELAAYAEHRQLVIEVADRGIRIAPSDSDRAALARQRERLGELRVRSHPVVRARATAW